MEIDKGAIITIGVLIALASSQGSLSSESPAGKAGSKVIGGAEGITNKAAGIVTSPGADIPDSSGPASAAIPMPRTATTVAEAAMQPFTGAKATTAPATNSAAYGDYWYSYCIATYQGLDWTHRRKSPNECRTWAKARSAVAP